MLKDNTKGWTQTITKNQTGLDRSSAEVITEAPSSDSGGVLPLADFGTINYSTSSANGSSLGSQNPVQIIMDRQLRQRQGLHQLDQLGGAFSNTWIRSN